MQFCASYHDLTGQNAQQIFKFKRILRTRSLSRDRFLSSCLDIDNPFHTYMDHDASW